MAATNNPRAGVVAERLIRWFGLLSLTAVVMIWLSIVVLGDRTWWSVMLLFGPRWVLTLPWLGVLPWLLVDIRRAAIPAIGGLAVAVLGILSFHLGLHRASVTPGVPIRVMELNAESGGGAERQAKIMAEFRTWNPDVIIIAECGPELVDALKVLTEYQARTSEFRGLCLLSRWPITSWQQRNQDDVFRQGGAGYIVRSIVNSPAGPLRVGLVHLATPRHALDSYFDLSELPKQGPNTRANMAQRDEESQLAHSWILASPEMPTIIAGDFNLTTESAIYSRYWGDFRNAFGRAGWGTGYTKHTRHWGTRIDHILTSNDIGTHASFVGNNVDSDHLPVIADLVLPGH